VGRVPRHGFVERLSATPSGWEVVETVGPTARLHADFLARRASSLPDSDGGDVDPGIGPLVVVLRRAVSPAVVLGRSQSDDLVDARRAGAAGLEVARRTSGGGAVLVVPGELCWVDVVVDRTLVKWADDVNRALVVVGEAWRRALVDLGLPGGDLELAKSSSGERALSQLACFAGVGTGEVLLGGAKIVGLCQRRGRSATLVQGALVGTLDPDRLVEVLALPMATRRRLVVALEHSAGGVGRHFATLEASRRLACAIAEHLPSAS